MRKAESYEEMAKAFDEKIRLETEDRRRKLDALRARFAGSPGEPCRHHPEVMRKLDMSKTEFHWTEFHRDPQPLLERCPLCSREASDLSGWKDWRRNGLPAAFFKATLEDLDQPEDVASILAEFSAKPAGALVLSGPPGLGKTHAACAILQGQSSGLYTSHSSLVADHRRTYSDRTADDIRSRCIDANMLVIDEVGRSVGGSDAQALLHDIFDARYSSGSPLILVSNCSGDELRATLGDPITDRLRGSVSALVEFRGTSHRGIAGDAYRKRLDYVRHLESRQQPFPK